MNRIRYALNMRSLFLAVFAVMAVAFSARAENLLQNGSFEQPPVTGRTPEGKGGSPALGTEPNGWAALSDDGQTDAGKVVAGITDEIARTGKQSLYVDFESVTAPARKAVLKTKLIPIKAGQAYRLSIWGRIDRKHPLALDERRPQMWLEIRFYQEDQVTEAGEPIAGAEFIPGNIIPGGPHQLLYSANKWRESSAQFVTPETANFVSITWFWLTSTDEGETGGTAYWDDAALEEEVASAPAPQSETPGAGAELTPPPAAEAAPLK